MENGEAGCPGRLNEKAINETKEARTRNQNNQDNTRKGNTKTKKKNHMQQEHTDQSTTKNQQQNPHPAWNPDSRWSR